LLVGYHVIGNDSQTGLRLDAGHVASQTSDFLSLVRMPLFSFLSGLVYALRPAKGPFAPFAIGKTRRLLVPMLIVGTGFALLQSFTSGTNGGEYDWTMLHVIPVAHYWFLEALFIIFLVTWGLERLGALDTPRNFLAVGILAALLHLFAPFPVYFGLLGATFLFPFFLLGVAARRFPVMLTSPWILALTLAVPVLMALSWAVTAAPNPDAPGAERLAMSLCICLVLLRMNLQSRSLAWVGAWSFGIYLFHPVFTAASRMVLTRLGVTDLLTLFVMGMVTGLAGSIALTALLRKVPLGHWALGERPAGARRKSATPAEQPAQA
ncbi:MAG: acyltransferase, partial [Burkholderiaceae bacterium]